MGEVCLARIISQPSGSFFAPLIYFHTCEVAYEPLRPPGQFQVQFPVRPKAAALWKRAAERRNIKANGARLELVST